MKKILTAIGNPEITKKLSEINSIEINYKDIQYKEGILEILEKDNKISLIIINEKIPGKIEINLLINNILKINSKIKIYLIIERDKNIKIKNKNIHIFKEINYELIKEKIIKNELLEDNKKELQEKFEIKNSEIEEIFKNKEEEDYCTDSSKIIIVWGDRNVGKSVITVILSSLISQHNKRVLVVDMDIKNGSINSILQTKKNINNVQKIKKNLDFVCTANNIKNIEKNYDIIFIDNYNKNKLNKNNKIIFISDSNLIGIEKSKKILNNFNLIKTKNNILLINNYNKNSIHIKILKSIFCEFNNIEKINYSEKYNLLINNFNIINLNIFFNKKYKKIIQKIINNK